MIYFLISKKWAQAYYAGSQEVQPLNVAGFAVQTDGRVKPLYYYNPAFGLNQYTNKPWQYSDYLSR